MQLTVREALEISPLNRAKMLAGHRGLTNIVTSVNVMEVPDIIAWVHPRELLITTMYPLRDDISKIETLIPQLAHKELAGLAIKPLRYIDTIPGMMIEDADRLGFPLLELPQDIAFIDIILPITGRILELKTEELIRSEIIHRQFLDLVLIGCGFNEIAKTLGNLIKRPVMIIDRFNKVLASNARFNSHFFRRELLNTIDQDTVILSDSLTLELVEEWDNRQTKRMKVGHTLDDLEIIECAVKIGDSRLGSVMVWNTKTARLEQFDLIAIEHASTITALKMMEARSIKQIEERLRNEVFNGLIAEDLPSRSSAIRSLKEQVDIDENQPFFVLITSINDPQNEVSTSFNKNIIDEALYTTRRYIQAINPGSLFWYQGYRLVVYFPGKSHYEKDVKDIQIVLLGICKKVNASNKVVKIFMGLSSQINNLWDFADGYQIALKCVEAKLSSIIKQLSEVVTFDDLGVFQIIPMQKNGVDLKVFFIKTLGKLIEYDRHNKTELIKTLYCLVQNNLNLSKTARDLHIHYNTLRYRLERIKQVSDIDIFNSQNKLAIEVSLQILPMMVDSFPSETGGSET